MFLTAEPIWFSFIMQLNKVLFWGGIPFPSQEQSPLEKSLSKYLPQRATYITIYLCVNVNLANYLSIYPK